MKKNIKRKTILLVVLLNKAIEVIDSLMQDSDNSTYMHWMNSIVVIKDDMLDSLSPIKKVVKPPVTSDTDSDNGDKLK